MDITAPWVVEPWTMTCKEWEGVDAQIFNLGRRITDRIVKKMGSGLRPTNAEIKEAADFWGITQRDIRVALDYYHFGHTYHVAPRINWRKYHKQIVTQAILQGKGVPNKVLREYPELVRLEVAPKPKPKAKPIKTGIKRALSKLRTLDEKERKLKLEEKQLRTSQPIGQYTPPYNRLVDKICEIQAKKADIWNTELRGMVIPETGATMWQIAIASKKLPVKPYGQERLLPFCVPELLAAVKKHTRAAKPKPAPTPAMPPILAAPPELAADVLGTEMGVAPAVAAKPRKQPKATSANVEKFRQLLLKHPDRRVQTIERMRGVLASHAIGRGFGESMEDYYVRRPDIRKTDEGLKALIAEAERGAVKPKRKTAAKAAKKTAAPKRKTTKKTAKPKTKKTAATPKLTPSQREYLAINGFVMVKRGGKYVRITG